MKKSKYIIVNLVTLSRVLILAPIIFMVSKNQLIFTAIWVAFSDFLDGFLARKWNVITSFGTKFDQYADKIASFIFLIYFLHQKQLNLFFISLIFLRELLVIIFRYYKYANFESNFIGKFKTFILYIFFIFLSCEHLLPVLNFNFKSVFIALIIVSSWLSFLLTINKINSQLVYFIGTTGLSAIFIKKATGTISSFFSCVLFFILLKTLAIEYKITILIILIIFHFSYYKKFLERINSINDDPGIYTLDETLAIILAWIYFGKIEIINLIILFVLFRFFDILKVLGIRAIEKQLSLLAEFRNIADDILAIFYASLILIIFQKYVS